MCQFNSNAVSQIVSVISASKVVNQVMPIVQEWNDIVQLKSDEVVSVNVYSAYDMFKLFFLCVVILTDRCLCVVFELSLFFHFFSNFTFLPFNDHFASPSPSLLFLSLSSSPRSSHIRFDRHTHTYTQQQTWAGREYNMKRGGGVRVKTEDCFSPSAPTPSFTHSLIHASLPLSTVVSVSHIRLEYGLAPRFKPKKKTGECVSSATRQWGRSESQREKERRSLARPCTRWLQPYASPHPLTSFCNYYHLCCCCCCYWCD